MEEQGSRPWSSSREGVISPLEERVNGPISDAWEAWVELNYRQRRDPTVHGAAEHLVYVGKKG